MPQNGQATHAPGRAGAPPAPPGRRRRRWLPWLLAGLGALPLAVGRAGVLPDSDTLWQIRPAD